MSKFNKLFKTIMEEVNDLTIDARVLYPNFPWRTKAPISKIGIEVPKDSYGHCKVPVDTAVEWFEKNGMPIDKFKYQIDKAISVWHPDITQYSADLFLTMYNIKNGDLIPTNKMHISIWEPWDTNYDYNLNDYMNIPLNKKFVWRSDELPYEAIKQEPLDETALAQDCWRTMIKNRHRFDNKN